VAFEQAIVSFAMVRTLESTHHCLLDASPRLESSEAVRSFELTPEQVASFHENGYVAGLKILEPSQLEESRRRLDSIRTRLMEVEPLLHEVEAEYLHRPDEVVLHFLGAWRIDEWFHDLVFSPRVTVPLAQCLTVRRLRFWHDQVFYKPPRHPGVVPWHQDYSYWTRATPAGHITLNLVLDDTDLRNGCLHFIPGSHRWGLFPKVGFGGDMDQILQHLPETQRRKFRPVPVPLKAGEASIHHSHTIHGSFSNFSARPRRAVVLNYMNAETRCGDGHSPLLRGVPLIPEDARIEGDFFPIALDLDSLSP